MAEGAAPDWATVPGGLAAVSGLAAPDRVRVLVADADPQIPWYVRNTLSEAGYTPIATGEPEEMNALIEPEKPRLLLLDMEMPGMDLSDVMRRMPQVTDAPRG